MSDVQQFAHYRVLHRYTPPEEYLNEGYLIIEEGDLIKVPRPVDLEKGTEENPDGWLKGTNTRNGLGGFFPSGPYVEYTAKPAAVMMRSKKTVPSTPTQPRKHNLKGAFFVRPILCACCQDYIWGTESVGSTCTDCCQCFHKDCEPIALASSICCKTPIAKKPQLEEKQVPLVEWDAMNVAQWMAAVNYHRYAHIFMKSNVNGEFLSLLNDTSLHNMKIEDEFHKQALLACVEKLRSAKKYDPVPLVKPEDARKADHRFIIYSFTSMQQCHCCSEYLWGLVQQGYQCQACGLCCHRKCSVQSLPKCNPAQMTLYHRESFNINNVFGMPLHEQFNVMQDKAPPVVILLTEELEKRGKGVNILDAYRSSSSTEDINKLKRLLSDVNVDRQSLELFDAKCICGTLKKYLRDLPNAVIHEDLFAGFIEESKNTNDEKCKENLWNLIEQLSEHHLCTFMYLLNHFVACIKMYANNDKQTTEAIAKISRVFCQILIRPPWEDIIDIVLDAEYNLRIITLLLQRRLHKVQDRQSKLPNVSSSSSFDETKSYTGSIETSEWYWSDISKDEVREKMSNTPDGTFLVRDATDKIKNNYTLVLRHKGDNRHLRISHKDGKFGLMEPLVFSSVVDLINYYSSHSFVHFNKMLETKLKYPICRPIQPKKDVTIEMKNEYKKSYKEYDKAMLKYEELYELHSSLTEDLQFKYQASEAIKQTILVYNEQVKLCEKNERLVPQSQIPKAHDNFELLKKRLRAVMETCGNLEREIRDQTTQSKDLFKEMNAIKPELQRLGQERDQLRRTLLDGGETPQSLELLVKPQDNDVTPDVIPHMDEKTWLVACGRSSAIDMLLGKPEGTFLIRPRENEPGNPYGLTIVSGEEIVHCKIGRMENGYGFAHPYFIHETLKDLVLHYKDTSLVEHNDVLDVTLKYPVLWSGTPEASASRVPGRNDRSRLMHDSTYVE